MIQIENRSQTAESKMARSQKTASSYNSHYEPPRVEMVLTSEEVEREVHYAGSIFTFSKPTF